MSLGITEKGSDGLFDNEIEFHGKYATMARELKEEIGVFTTLREAYVTSAIIGFLNGRQDTNEDVVDDTNNPASIFPNEISKRKLDLRFIYRLMMLLKEEDSYSLDDYRDRAFKDDPEEHAETLKENMKVFNSYACGGLELLYERFSQFNNVDDLVDSVYEFIHELSVASDLIADDDELPDFAPTFD